MASKPTLEDALAKIASDYALDRVDVGRMPVGERIVWIATVHWTGHSTRGIPCMTAHSDLSIRHALDEALRTAAEDRAPQHSVPCELPTLEAA